MTKDINPIAGLDDNVTATTNTAAGHQLPAADKTVDANPESSKLRQGTAQRDPNDVSQKRRLNAIVHGVYAKDLVLPWESAEDFTKLYQAYHEEFNVEGVSEEEALLDVVVCDWQQRRAAKAAQMGFEGDPLVLKLLGGNAGMWADLLNALRNDPESKLAQRENRRKAIDEGLQKLFDHEAESYKKLQATTSATPDDEAHVRRRSFAALIKMAKNQDMRTSEETEAEAFKKAYDPDGMIKISKLQAAIAARKHKAMAHLVAIKEFKRQYGRGTSLVLPQTSSVPLVPEKEE